MVGLCDESSRVERVGIIFSVSCSQNFIKWFKYILGAVRSGTVSPCSLTRFTSITIALLWCKSGVNPEGKKPFITVQREVFYCHGP